jgi:uncharacterized protein (DUF2126 family)
MSDFSTHPPDLTLIYVEQGMLRAHVIRAKLEDAGIPVMFEYESAGPVFGITVDGLGQVRILVPTRYADEARRLLEEGPLPDEDAQDEEMEEDEQAEELL